MRRPPKPGPPRIGSPEATAAVEAKTAAAPAATNFDSGFAHRVSGASGCHPIRPDAYATGCCAVRRSFGEVTGEMPRGGSGASLLASFSSHRVRRLTCAILVLVGRTATFQLLLRWGNEHAQTRIHPSPAAPLAFPAPLFLLFRTL
jgi:hypothetical protein